MLNIITVMGRLTKDPETRYTQSNKPVSSFSIAVDNDYPKKTIFINCVAWNNTSEFVSKYFHKGDMAVISGRLDFNEWEDKQGNKRKDAEIVVDNIYFGQSKKTESSEWTKSVAPVPSELSDLKEVFEDDGELPF